MQNRICNTSFIFIFFLLSCCSVGPEYKKPNSIEIGDRFLEADIKWLESKPNADIERGNWWKIFDNAELNVLQEKLNKNNQNIIAAANSYKSALALVEQSRSSYFPSVNSSYDLTRSREKSYNNQYSTNSTHNFSLGTSWEVDIWGRYALKENIAAAAASKDDLASIKLSNQSSLAQYYFEIRMLDKIQGILDEILMINRSIVNYIRQRFNAGVANSYDLLQAENNYNTANNAALDNKANRAKYQHAIAALIGESPSLFILPVVKNIAVNNINIPIFIPSELLQRRPDIAKAEKLVQQANAQIGSAKTAFFPALSLGGNAAFSGNGWGNILSMPNFIWSLGPQLTVNVFDFGGKSSKLKSAKANYEATVASYRQVVISAFVEVEDQLSSLLFLSKQLEFSNNNLLNSKKRFAYVNSQYKAGIVDEYQLFMAKIEYSQAMQDYISKLFLKRSTEIALIKVLGGGWKED